MEPLIKRSGDDYYDDEDAVTSGQSPAFCAKVQQMMALTPMVKVMSVMSGVSESFYVCTSIHLFMMYGHVTAHGV